MINTSLPLFFPLPLIIVKIFWLFFGGEGGGDETLKGLETFFGGFFGLGKVFQKGISAQEDI